MNLPQPSLASMALAAATATAPPQATLRLQLNRGFRFDDARAQLPYFQQLGISHLFVSPILSARAGSMHGYDVIDHQSVNPELGGEEGLRRLVAELRARGMGLIVDVVPNHMAVGGHDNARWLEMLEWGRDSRNASFFDIDWDVPDPALNGRVLLPFLGTPYGEALAAGELQLEHRDGRLSVAYHDHRFPLAPRSYPPLLREAALPELARRFQDVFRLRGRMARQAAFDAAAEQLAAQVHAPDNRAALQRVIAAYDARTAAGRERLHRLLEQQHYRLSWWRSAADEINWRRFFDVNELAALRIQERFVFDAVHATTFRLYAAGLIDGLRIDHVDGLADPRGYCRELRRRLTRLGLRRPADAPRAPPLIIVEKILAPGEKLALDWHVDGTSGYSFMNDVSALLHDAKGEAALTQLWTQRLGCDFAEEERRARRRIALELFSSEFAACAHALHQIARDDPATRDWSLGAIRRVLLELLVHFPVYRTYADARGRSAADADIMRRVVEAAEPGCRPGERRLLHQIDHWLGGEAARAVGGQRQRRTRLRALARFQQLTSPLAAKAVEDTAFYRHGRLVSRNEVGADPGQFSIAPASFHISCVDRQRRYPRALLATATHDHKRGEDVRMRLAVLSETPQSWATAVAEWQAMNADLRQSLPGAAPDRIDEYILYQMLVGTWPPELRPDDSQGLTRFRERLAAWQCKAVREAKRHSGWLEPNLDYEQACDAFLAALLDPERSPKFLQSLHRLVAAIAPAGAVKSLSQALLRMTTPGIPDLYQGAEFWDFSMVDPDNRRAVDFAARSAALAADTAAEQLLLNWRSGAIKQRLIQRVLALRRECAAVFAEGRYRALRIEGPQQGRLLAFARHDADIAVIVVVPLFSEALMQPGAGLRIPAQLWRDTVVHLPPSLRRRRWQDALDGRELSLRGDRRLPLNRLLDPWPLALMHSRPGVRR